MNDNIISGGFRLDIKFAHEIVASVHDRDQLRATMARIRANHGAEILRDPAGCASRMLTNQVSSVMDWYDNLQWAIDVELSPAMMADFGIHSISSDDVQGPDSPPPQPRPVWAL